MAGRTIALLEARRATELASLVEAYGGIPFHAPALREEPTEDLPAIGGLLDQIAESDLDVMIFQTGVGARALFHGIAALGRLDEWQAALAKATVVVRGPKPTAVLREFATRIDVRAPEPYTTADVLRELASHDLSDRFTVVQHYGEPNIELVEALQVRGARVHEIEVYRWALPNDLTTIETFICDLPTGRFDAMVVTSQVQVRHLFQIAERLGQAEHLASVLRHHTVVGAVGPIAARALRAHGVTVDLEPEHPKMGPMIRDLASYLERNVGWPTHLP